MNQEVSSQQPQEIIRKCITCEEEKSLEDFHFHHGNTDKKRNQCKECTRERNRQWHVKNPGRQRELYLLRKHNMTVEEYNKLAEEQDYVCFICKQPNPDGRPLVVDHNHTTGDRRALLCHRCNAGLGFSREEIYILEGMIQYLKIYA